VNAVRTATILLVCLGLALPSAPGIALCIGADGDVELVGASHASCAGEESGSCDRSSDRACKSDRGLEAVEQSRDCRDVIVSRDIAASPPSLSSEKHRSHQPLAQAFAGDRPVEYDAIVVAGAGLTANLHCVTALRSLSTVVLLL
jgi:hypothetical protein